MNVTRERRCDVLTAECLSQLQQEVAGVLAFLDGAIGERAFKLAVAVLVIGNGRNQWSNYAGCVARGASASNGEER